MSARELLRRGIAAYAARDLEPRSGERAGFEGGARWMARAMGAPLGDEAASLASRVLWVKYGASLAAAVGAGAIACKIHPIAGAAAFVVAFYAVEVQGVFVVPLVIQGERAPFRRSRALACAPGGTVRALATVMPIAGWMLFAGPFRGFTQAWCEGCLAVLAWFEDSRDVEAARA